MRAVLIEQPGQVSLQTVPDPVLAPGEVMVKVAACGLCGTDIHLYEGEIHGAYPLIAGHEVSGTIVEVGPEVPSNWAVAQRVTFDPNLACGECEFCRRGLYNHCRAWTGVGITRAGGFAEHVSVPASVLYDLGELSFAAGAFVEPLSCVAHGLNRAPARPGDDVLIFGAGPIGLLLMQAARAQGAERVVMTDVQPHRLAVADQLGAVSVPADEAQDGRLRALAPIGYDLVIDATGVPRVVEAALDYVRPAGQMLVFGVCPENAHIPLSPYDVYRRDLSIVGSFALNRTFPPALEWLSRGAVQVAPLLTHRVALDDLPDILAGRREMPGRLKVQVQLT